MECKLLCEVCYVFLNPSDFSVKGLRKIWQYPIILRYKSRRDSIWIAPDAIRGIRDIISQPGTGWTKKHAYEHLHTNLVSNCLQYQTQRIYTHQKKSTWIIQIHLGYSKKEKMPFIPHQWHGRSPAYCNAYPSYNRLGFLGQEISN